MAKWYALRERVVWTRDYTHAGGNLAFVCGCVSKMAQRQRQRALWDDPNLARFVVEGVPTGNQLGTGSYGAVEEVLEGY